MFREMPYGKEKVMHYRNPTGAAPIITERLKARTWFGFAEVETEVPEPLWRKIEDMPPFFHNRQDHDEAVP